MKLHTLVLEDGEDGANAGANQIQEPVRTRADYLRRKQLESRPSLRCRSFGLCRMIEEALRGTDLDGSGKLTVYAGQDRLFPGKGGYIRDAGFQISVYYLDPEEIRALAEADPAAEPQVIWGILRRVLLEIARRNGRPREILDRVEAAFDRIAAGGFTREDRVARLTKRSADGGMTAHVYRLLSAGSGEGWRMDVTDRRGRVLCQAVMDRDTRYVNRLASRLYDRAEWQGSAFVILERFGREVFRIDVPSPDEGAETAPSPTET